MVKQMVDFLTNCRPSRLWRQIHRSIYETVNTFNARIQIIQCLVYKRDYEEKHSNHNSRRFARL